MRWRWRVLAGFAVVCAATAVVLTDMGFFTSDKTELKRLLGAPAAVWVDEARLQSWSLDPDHKPPAYYLLREMDEATFRRLAGQSGLAVVPSTALAEAVWRLPDGVHLSGWNAPEVPGGAGLQAQGRLGAANVWLRWHAGRLSMVVRRAG